MIAKEDTSPELLLICTQGIYSICVVCPLHLLPQPQKLVHRKFTLAVRLGAFWSLAKRFIVGGVCWFQTGPRPVSNNLQVQDQFAKRQVWAALTSTIWSLLCSSNAQSAPRFRRCNSQSLVFEVVSQRGTHWTLPQLTLEIKSWTYADEIWKWFSLFQIIGMSQKYRSRSIYRICDSFSPMWK